MSVYATYIPTEQDEMRAEVVTEKLVGMIGDNHQKAVSYLDQLTQFRAVAREVYTDVAEWKWWILDEMIEAVEARRVQLHDTSPQTPLLGGEGQLDPDVVSVK